MPQIFKIGSYTVYFWSNEGEPLEPIHIHAAEGRATAAGTKIWITSSGKPFLPKIPLISPLSHRTEMG